jgi:HK97 family phage major capsid protein
MAMSQTLIEKRAAFLAEAQAAVDAAEADARDLTVEEDALIATSLRSAAELDDTIKQHQDLEARKAQAAEVRKETSVANIVVKSEARTYAPQATTSFIRDAYSAQFNNDFQASERLARHMQEERVERRDVTSANFAGLLVPQFLTDLAAPFARAGRPTANIARKHQLPPEGLTLSISKVTTGSATALQTEGAAVQETNMDDTKLDLTVKTFAGQQNVSRQSLERGTNIDSLVMSDLVSSYHTVLNAAVVADIMTNATSVAYTDASPTVAELYPKILSAISGIQTDYFQGPDVIIMHPRRLAFILAAVDDQKRPLAVPVPNYNGQPAFASGDGAPTYGSSKYSIVGLPVVTDAGILITSGAGANEDTIFVGNTQELHLWEQGSGEPMMLRFEQPKGAELDVTMIVYGYSAFTSNRYAASWARIGGTGLVTPTF